MRLTARNPGLRRDFSPKAAGINNHIDDTDMAKLNRI